MAFYSNFFRFEINVSRDYYEKKTDATACLSLIGAKKINKEKMAFDEKHITVDEFLALATSGHCFCNLFAPDPNKEYWIETKEGRKYQTKPMYAKGPNKGAMKLAFKADQFFRGAQTIFVDIDYTRFSDIQSYLRTLTYPPTCTYMSFSDAQDKHGVVSRRFRLVYVFDTILDKEQFCGISRGLTEQIIKDTNEAMDDDCGCRPSQYMNGVYNNQESYTCYQIYSIGDIPEASSSRQDNTLSVDQEPSVGIFDEFLLQDMTSLCPEDFKHRYSIKYKYLYRSEKAYWEDSMYQETGDDYLQLWYYREKVKDGEHRRRKLFKNACLRRLMYPDIDANTLLFNLYIDLLRFIDYSDKVITLTCLKRKVINAMKMTVDELRNYCGYEIRYWQSNKPKYIFKNGISKSVIRSKLRDIRYANISCNYDENLSIKENIAAGIDVPERTLYRYCELMGIKPNPHKVDMKVFRDYYDPNKSQRENLKLFTNKGYHLALGKLNQMAKQLNELNEHPDSPLEFGIKNTWAVPSFCFDEWVMPAMETPKESVTNEPLVIPQSWIPEILL